MRISVIASYTARESAGSGSAAGLVTTTRHVTLEADPAEPAAAFADRVHDLLIPRPVDLVSLTPAQFRMSSCRRLCTHLGGRIDEAQTVGAMLAAAAEKMGTPPVLELRPVPLVDA